MKIRNGFVSNSSSSSFVYIFDKEKVDSEMDDFLKYFLGTPVEFMGGQVYVDTVNNFEDYHSLADVIENLLIEETDETRKTRWGGSETVRRVKTTEEILESFPADANKEQIKEYLDKLSLDTEKVEDLTFKVACQIELDFYAFARKTGGITESSSF